MNGSVITAGPHRFLCSDLLTTRLEDELVQDRTYDLVYSDPPWGPGHARYWRTVTENPGEPRWEELLDRFAAVACRARCGAFVEMGLRWQADVEAAMTRHGAALLDTWGVRYRSGDKWLPSLVQRYATSTDALLPFDVDPTGYVGYAVPKMLVGGAVAQLGARSVLDPFLGLGYTFQAALDHGITCYGNELNPARLRRAVGRASGRYEIVGLEMLPSSQGA